MKQERGIPSHVFRVFFSLKFLRRMAENAYNLEVVERWHCTA
jgi:hypothetical protein